MIARGSLGPFSYGPISRRRVSLTPWSDMMCRRVPDPDAEWEWRPEFLVETAKRRIDALTQSTALNAARSCMLSLGLTLSDRSGPDVVFIADRDLAERLIDWLDGLFSRTEQADDPRQQIMRMHTRKATNSASRFALRREGNRRSNVLSVAITRAVRRMLLQVLKPVRRCMKCYTALTALATLRVGAYSQWHAFRRSGLDQGTRGASAACALSRSKTWRRWSVLVTSTSMSRCESTTTSL